MKYIFDGSALPPAFCLTKTLQDPNRFLLRS